MYLDQTEVKFGLIAKSKMLNSHDSELLFTLVI